MQSPRQLIPFRALLDHDISRLRMTLLVALRRRAARIDRIVVQLNDTLTVYAVGLALLAVIVYWRSGPGLR
jgi:hypothetical protein